MAEIDDGDEASRGAPLGERAFHAELTAIIPHLRAYGRSLTGCRDRADDLAQETLLKAWAARHSFMAGTSFKAWSFTILRNVYFGQLRRQKFTGEYNEFEAENTLRISGGQLERLEAVDVLRAMATLPAPQREALILFSIGHFSYEEMAQICGVAVGTIKSRIARARASLSATLESGILPDSRHDFVLKGEVMDAFLAELRKVAPEPVLNRIAA